MGWLPIILLGLLTFVLLWRFIGRDKAALQFLGAALLLALAGYAWQGRPELPGTTKAAPLREAVPDSAFAEMRGDMLGRFDRASYYLNLAEAYQRRGDTQSGAEVIGAGLRTARNDPDLWVGMGVALVAHSGGQMSPAAQLAFQRAARLAPDHPGPPFFYALALAQGGNFDEAERMWRQLRSQPQLTEQYRRAIDEQLETLPFARQAAGMAAPATAPPP